MQSSQGVVSIENWSYVEIKSPKFSCREYIELPQKG